MRTTSEAGRRRKVSGLDQDSGEGGRAEPRNVGTPGLLEQPQEPPQDVLGRLMGVGHWVSKLHSNYLSISSFSLTSIW